MKRKFSHCLQIVLALILALSWIVSPAPEAVRAAPAQPEYTIISEDTTWTSDVTLSEDLIIQEGATLTITSGVTVEIYCVAGDPYRKFCAIRAQSGKNVKNVHFLKMATGVAQPIAFSPQGIGLRTGCDP